METNAKNNGQVKVANTVKAENKEQKFVAGNPVNKESKTADVKKEFPKDANGVMPADPNANKKEQSPETSDSPKNDQQEKEGQHEKTKKELKAELENNKPALNLEQTLKKIKELGRLSSQRDKLMETIATLEAFEIKQLDEAEETTASHFQGCTLTITDDQGNTFSAKNPFIIDTVAKNVNSLCVEKLAEIEGQISLKA
ncbi:hypothetical protein OQY15_09665 [Pedobacter sp. MC2016-15]|uniref:hypothetical protein n=1 Tax=Pedobacter sp. MC2016-15 TaxID=2994473 RepID=UPI002247324D|nr:hypothetical protein [Pedobacter sp. MC2016-15]MCX2479356.1 hypothetical protein [Pedobacter sp. MC2016-15]